MLAVRARGVTSRHRRARSPGRGSVKFESGVFAMDAKRSVLVVEDDEAIRFGVVDALEAEGFATVEAKDGVEGASLAVRGEFDLVLLDLGLPKKDGMDVLREVRAARPKLPVIVLTARGQEEDRVRGLKLGADDYVVKPFSAKELLARIEAVLRRSCERPLDLERVRFGGVTIDFPRAEIRHKGGERFELSEREAELLRFLIKNAGRVVSRDELLQDVWRVDPRGVETRTIDMHVVRLREKLKDDSDQPRFVKTVRGRGYMFAERLDADE
jgi:DNA-binding response OmpR family regulator